jgi:hypothetical protein
VTFAFCRLKEFFEESLNDFADSKLNFLSRSYNIPASVDPLTRSHSPGDCVKKALEKLELNDIKDILPGMKM